MPAIDSLPPLVLLICLVAVFSVVIELGYQGGLRIRSEEGGLSKHPVEASVTAAILSLLAFLLAFSFGASASRYMKLRSLALNDANIVGTLYLRCDLLPGEMIPVAKPLVREYLQIRNDAISKRDPEEVAAAIQRSQEIQKALWKIGVKARIEGNSTAVNLFISTLNDLIDNDTTRQSSAYSNRMPPMLWISLSFLGVLATSMLGVSSGLHGRRSRLATTALIVAFSLVTVLIVDLDRPFRMLFYKADMTAQRVLESMESDE